VAEATSPAARAYLAAELPEPRSSWRETDFTVIDFETTGLDPDRDEIISFATVTVRDGRVVLDDARYELVRPKRMPDWDTIRIHGLRESDLEDAPPLSELIDHLLAALSGRVLVAHVAAIERGFLQSALRPLGLELRNPIVDTAALAIELSRLRREPPPEREPVALDEMARSLGLPVHRRHTADGDALTTAQAFIALATHLDAIKPQTVDSLLHASGAHPGRLRQLLGRFGLGH
jgi:DNA polymerase-3 subunit epsilon